MWHYEWVVFRINTVLVSQLSSWICDIMDNISEGRLAAERMEAERFGRLCGGDNGTDDQ